jgi:hypothetical protein
MRYLIPLLAFAATASAQYPDPYRVPVRTTVTRTVTEYQPQIEPPVRYVTLQPVPVVYTEAVPVNVYYYVERPRYVGPVRRLFGVR